MAASHDFRKHFSKKRLKEFYINEIRYKSTRGIDHIGSAAFEGRLSENIEIIHRKVRNGTYQFSQYREKLISRGAERNPRVISIPTIRDKLVQKAVAEILKANFGDQIPFLHSIVTAVILTYCSSVFQCVLRLDVKDFYPSIKHDLLIKRVKKKIRKREILHLIENAVSRKTVAHPNRKRETATKGVPQGLSISNILANIYLSTVDEKYSSLHTIKYFRYVDDILIFCNPVDVSAIQAEIEQDCMVLGLTLHKKDDNPTKASTGNVADGFSYLGYQFENTGVSVRKKSVDHLRASIIKLLTNYKYAKYKDIDLLLWTLNLRITGCIFNESKYGWLFFFSQIDDRSLLGSLDHFVQSQIKRFGIHPGNLKTFMRAFHEITRNLSRTNYIPNFDTLPIDEKKQLLGDIFKVRDLPSNRQEIENLFKKKIYKTVKDLERDLSGIS